MSQTKTGWVEQALKNEWRLSMRPMIEALWSDWRIGIIVVIVVSSGAGLISAWLTPRRR